MVCCASSSFAALTGPINLEPRQELRQVELHRSPQKSSELYFYTSLPRQGSKIRIIELIGGDDIDIHCKMHTVDLEGIHALNINGRRRPYEALSYTWHSQILSRSIWCDGKVLDITKSLYDALHTLRRPSTGRLLWIDQMCINQANIQERSSQVHLMRFIYNRADLVIAWIGKEDEFTASAFRLIDQIVTKHVSADVSLKTEPETIWNKESMKSMHLPPFPSFEWEALARLFERTYFRRIWVVQEIVVASRVVIRCGSLAIRWEYVEYIARSLLASLWIRPLKQMYGSNAIPNFVQTISNIRASFSELKGGRGMPLSLILNASRRFESTDPRDKVIALVGLADHQSLGPLSSAMFDYSKPVEDIYTEVTGYLIQRERSLNLLSSVEDISDRTFLSLPSWVPNYSMWQRHTILGSSIRVSHLNFNAAGRTPVSVRWTGRSKVIAIDGFANDTVDKVSASSLDRQTEDMDVVLQWLQLVEPLIRHGRLRIEAFWETLIGTGDRYNFPAPEQYGTHIETYSFHSKQRIKTQRKMDATQESNTLVYQAASGYLAPHRKLFTTIGGLIGLGPRSMLSGDLLCILSGGRVPYVLRKEGSHHGLVGESYVHGLMEGQALEKKYEMSSFLVH